MPRVGNRKFPYTKRGMQDAKRYGRSTGQSVNSGQAGRGGSGIASPRGGARRGPGIARPGVGRGGIARPGVGRGGPRMTNRGGARRMPGSGGSRVMGNRPGFKKERRRGSANALAPARNRRRGY